MTGVDGNLVELRHHPVNAEGLIPQLSGFDDLIADFYAKRK